MFNKKQKRLNKIVSLIYLPAECLVNTRLQKNESH